MNVYERYMLFFHSFFYLTDINVYLQIFSPEKSLITFTNYSERFFLEDIGRYFLYQFPKENQKQMR